jgi:hypothetical protein
LHGPGRTVHLQCELQMVCPRIRIGLNIYHPMNEVDGGLRHGRLPFPESRFRLRILGDRRGNQRHCIGLERFGDLERCNACRGLPADTGTRSKRRKRRVELGPHGELRKRGLMEKREVRERIKKSLP